VNIEDENEVWALKNEHERGNVRANKLNGPMLMKYIKKDKKMEYGQWDHTKDWFKFKRRKEDKEYKPDQTFTEIYEIRGPVLPDGLTFTVEGVMYALGVEPEMVINSERTISLYKIKDEDRLRVKCAYYPWYVIEPTG